MPALAQTPAFAPRTLSGSASRPAMGLKIGQSDPQRQITPQLAAATSRVVAHQGWREIPDAGGAAHQWRIVARRWKEDLEQVRCYASAPKPGLAVLAIALRPTTARLTFIGRVVHDGHMPAGTAVMTRPGVSTGIEFRTPCDMLHLFVPRARLTEINAETGNEREADQTGWLRASDPVIERLAWLLLKDGDGNRRSSELYRDGIAVAIISRFLECTSPDRADRAARGLVKWRLKRVQAYIEEKLGEPLSLADLARCAGLSRMHFAAQFRAATGTRPHEYLVRRRIQRAQEMLRTGSTPLVEVALSVGFQTQAHFTTVFRRLLGETPGRWREAQRAS